jgi:hypothetical protein
MSNHYDIIERMWTTANLKVNIIKLSPEVIAEKLAVLSDGSGTLTSGEFDQFILNNTIINVPTIFSILEQYEDDGDKVVSLARELRKIILEVNPLLDPELLVLTSENRIKIPDQSDKPGDVRALNSNPLWEKIRFKNDAPPSFDDLVPGGFISAGRRFSQSMFNNNFITHVVEELDRPISIIKHEPDAIPEIFKEKYVFESDKEYSAELKYKMYVLTKCMDDFTQLFFELDKEGATEEYGEEGLIDILYTACLVHNPFLDWNDIDLEKVKRVVIKMFGDGVKVSKFSKSQPKTKTFVGDKDLSDITEEEVLSLPDRMKAKVIGQDEVIDSMCEVIQVSSCGLKEKGQPIGSFMLNGATGVGKCHGKGTKILMYDGSVMKVEDIKVGDTLMGDDSKPREVLSLARGSDRMFKVIPSRSDSFICNHVHILTLKDFITGEVVDIPIREYMECSSTFNRRKRLFRVAVDYPESETSQSPYKFGLCIGDDAAYDEVLFIPEHYIVNSKRKRLELISGIVDSSGCYNEGGCFIVQTMSQDLSKDIVNVVLSVGMYASSKIKTVGDERYFEVSIYGNVSLLSLINKKDCLTTFTNSSDFSMLNFTIEEVNFDDYYGFTLSGNGRYLLHDYIVTHNTHCARILAEELCGSADNLIRIDCSEYSQPHEVSKLLGCFTPETTVTMEGGLVKPIKDIVVGDKVISKDGKVKEVKDTFKYNYDSVLYNIRVANDNRVIRCTPKHEFLVVKTKRCWYKNREYVMCKPTCGRNTLEYPCTNKLYENYSPEWVQAKDVKVGDLVLQARYNDSRSYPTVLDLLDFYPEGAHDNEYIWCKKEGGSNKVKRFIQVNKDFVRMAGYYVAEGGADKKRIDISFHYNEVDYQNEVVSLIHNIFGKEIYFSRCPSEEKSGHLRKRSYTGSKIVASLFSTLFGHGGAENKKLPTWWFDLSNDL